VANHEWTGTARRGALMSALAMTLALPAWGMALTKNPIVEAVRHQHCDTAVKLINPEVRSNDAPTAFLAARMLDEGICVQRDPELAAHFFAYAAELGDRAAVLDYAAKVGLGIGTAQDYGRAGELCRAAGVDSQKQLSTPVLGYACTVSSIAGRLLREELPVGAFTPVAGAAVRVEFTPASRALRVIAVPQVGRSALVTGSYIRQPVIDADREINKAWQQAVQQVPAPAAAGAEAHAVDLSIDVDMTLEQGHQKLAQDLQRLMPGDLHPTVTVTPH
jgi:hypothetical protein